MALDPAWIALIGTLCGGAGLKLLEYWLGRSKVRIEEADKIRSEQRQQITELKAEKKELEKEVDEWRDKYWELREKDARPDI